MYSNKPLLTNSNAMPKTKFPEFRVTLKEINARVSHKKHIESPKSNANQIKTSNSVFYPTDSASLLPLPYSGETQRNYSSWEPEFAAVEVQVQVQVQVLDHHSRLDKSPPLIVAVLAVVEAA
jgi:hypothetical protein